MKSRQDLIVLTPTRMISISIETIIKLSFIHSDIALKKTCLPLPPARHVWAVALPQRHGMPRYSHQCFHTDTNIRCNIRDTEALPRRWRQLAADHRRAYGQHGNWHWPRGHLWQHRTGLRAAMSDIVLGMQLPSVRGPSLLKPSCALWWFYDTVSHKRASAYRYGRRLGPTVDCHRRHDRRSANISGQTLRFSVTWNIFHVYIWYAWIRKGLSSPP